MRRLVRTCLALASSPGRCASLRPGRGGSPSPPVGIVDASFVSPALGGERERLRVYVPSRVHARAPCPVLYLLHGFGGDWTDWSEAGGSPTS